MELIIQSFIFIITFVMLFKRDRFCSIFYAVLFLYLLPVEICSGYLPFLLKIEFKDNVYWPFYWFSTFSFFSLWFFVFVKSKSKNNICCVKENNCIEKKRSIKVRLAYFIIIFILLIQCLVILLSFGDISYQHLASVEYKKTHPLLIFGSMLFLVSKPLILLLLFKYLSSIRFERRFCMLLLLWSISQNFMYGSLAGSRSGILSILIAVIFAIYGQMKVSLKNSIKMGFVALAILGIMQGIRNFRTEGDVNVVNEEYTILQNDYADPAMTTLAAIEYNAIDPIEVIISNVTRIFPFVDYPYLYITITEMFAPGLADEANAFGFYIFTEGYMFAGMLGFIYNVIIIGGLLLYWRRLGRTNNKQYNIFILALMMSFFFAMVRAQSVWFIRNLWQYIIPISILYSWLMNIKINYKKLLF